MSSTVNSLSTFTLAVKNIKIPYQINRNRQLNTDLKARDTLLNIPRFLFDVPLDKDD